MPRLTLDQDRGLRQAILHLITVHGCRRLAFVRGPAMNDEAERRYALYRTVLAEEGLEVDPALICDGTFEKPAGEAAVARLVDDRRVAFDALVAANDYMALGALEALEARGIDVPGDVAVVGFDDIEDARFSSPPLTTVRQPLYQQGEAALDRVLAQLEGRPVELDTVHATELVVRRSCGCLTDPAGRAGAAAAPPARRGRRGAAGAGRGRSARTSWCAPSTARTRRCRPAGKGRSWMRSRRSCAAPAPACSPPR